MNRPINPLHHGFRRDRFQLHWVCKATGNVLSLAEVERIVASRLAVEQAKAAPVRTRSERKEMVRERFEEMRTAI